MVYVKRGDIVYLKSGIDNNNLGKNVQHMARPYVVISNNRNNRYSPTIQLAAMSKQISKSNYPMHVLISKEDYPCLRHDSIILLEQVVTINKDLVERRSTSLTDEDINKLNRAVFVQMIDEEVCCNII